MFPTRTCLSSEEIKDPPRPVDTSTQGPFCISKEETSDQASWKSEKKWAKEQFTKYLVFLEANHKKMEGKPHRVLWKLYQQMEQFIKTRNFRQCKSKHQKMLDQYKSVSRILKHFMEDPLVEIETQEQERTHLREFYQGNKTSHQNPSKITVNGFPHNVSKMDLKPTNDRYLDDGQEYLQKRKEPFGAVFGNFPSLGMQDSYEEKLLECHNIFLQWTGKLNDLFSRSQF